MKKFLISALFLVIIFLFLQKASLLVLPSDILYTIPSFSTEKWIRANNSLLADPLFQFEPWRYFAKKQILNHSLPLWNDLNGAGAPFMANPQSQIFFPLNILYYIFPQEISLITIPFCKFLLFITFSYLYLKSINLSKKSSFLGAILSSSGFLLLWIQWPHTNVYIIFPLLLLLTEKYILDTRKLRIFLIFAGIYFIGFLGGHPETLFLTAIVHILYVLLRFHSRIFIIFLSIAFAFFLSAFATFPFLEYLLNSSMLRYRSDLIFDHSIPLIAVILNFFPFFLGAPHLNYYKPIPGTNFQEALGAYTGIISLILIILYLMRYKANSIFKSWVFIIIFSFIWTYNLPFITNIIQHTPFNLSANHRMIAFIGFGVSVLAAISYDKILKRKILKFSDYLNYIFFLTIVFLFIPFLVFIKNDYLEFYSFLLPFILVVLVSTYIFFLKYKDNSFLGFFLVFSQTILFLITYNTISNKDTYYPKTNITEFLESKKNIRVLEVGNPSLPPAINMPYRIEMAENNDALGVYWYDKQFDINFSEKNHWKKVDTVELENLRKFGITHIISDYDINLKKVNIQNLIEDRILINKKTRFKVRNSEGYLSQLRFITLNFNRLNNCLIYLNIYSEDNVITSTLLECKNARDRHFLTVSLDEIYLRSDKEYIIELVPVKINDNDFIALAGSGNMPYLDLLLENKDTYKKDFSDKGIYVFEIPDSDPLIDTDYELLSDKSDEILFKVTTKGPVLEIRKTYYPGWSAYIDNKETQIKNSNPFMEINVSEGEHIIRLKYESDLVKLSFYTSLILFAVYLILFIREFNIFKILFKND